MIGGGQSGYQPVKVYLGLLESSRPDQTKIFGELEGKLFDVNLACAAHLAQSPGERASAYALADFYFPKNIQGFLERGECARKLFDQVTAFAQSQGASKLRGPGGEKVVHEITEIRVLPPLQKPNKSLVIGFSDRARAETTPRAEIPTAFYKLPQTLIADGAPIAVQRDDVPRRQAGEANSGRKSLGIHRRSYVDGRPYCTRYQQARGTHHE